MSFFDDQDHPPRRIAPPPRKSSRQEEKERRREERLAREEAEREKIRQAEASKTYPDWTDEHIERVETVASDMLLASIDSQRAIMRVLFDLVQEDGR